ncbi:hypothetical protein R83H12_00789 [Fibrobacteria bacterium R8-3-H12]
MNLFRKYGINDSVFFYNKDIEVDFYVPEKFTAIQACYSLDSASGTFDREAGALLKASKVLKCKRLLIITRDEEKTLEIGGKKIEIIPIWKWLLD